MNWLIILKVILEGLAVAFAAYFIPQREVRVENVLAIGLSAAAVFLLLDTFAPSVGAGARQGAGFGIGLDNVGWSKVGGECGSCNVDTDVNTDFSLVETREGFEDCKFACRSNPKMCSRVGGACSQYGSGADNRSPNSISGFEQSSCGSMDEEPSLAQLHYDVQKHLYQDEMMNERCQGRKPPTGCCLAPLDAGIVKDPSGLQGLAPNWSQTNVGSRSLGMIPDHRRIPVNKNTNEYKLVPGYYSALVLESGYNQNVDAYNSIEYRQNLDDLPVNLRTADICK